MTDNPNNNPTEALDQRINRYLRNQMTAEEEATFVSDMQTDGELRLRAFAIASMARAIKEKRHDTDNSIMERVGNTVKMPSRRRRVWAAAAIAALIIAGHYGYGEYSYRQRNTFVAQYINATADRQPSDVRGDADNQLATRLDSIATRIQTERDMQPIITALKPLYNHRLTDVECAQNANRTAWLLAIAYIKDGNKEQAANVLRQIMKENEGMPIAMKASELLKKL